MKKQLDIHELKRRIDQLQQLVDGQDTVQFSPDEKPVVWWGDYEVMKFLGKSLSTIKRHRKKNILKGFPIGGRYYYDREDILALKYAYLK